MNSFDSFRFTSVVWVKIIFSGIISWVCIFAFRGKIDNCWLLDDDRWSVSLAWECNGSNTSLVSMIACPSGKWSLLYLRAFNSWIVSIQFTVFLVSVFCHVYAVNFDHFNCNQDSCALTVICTKAWSDFILLFSAYTE